MDYMISVLEEVAVITLIPFCLVAICIRAVFHKRNSGKPAKPPHPLKSRSRSLTLPLPPGTTRKQSTATQGSSILLSKLPLEVRQLIWKECLGRRTIGLKIHKRRLISLVFRRTGSQKDEEEEVARRHFNGKSRKRASRHLYRPHLLQVLFTCRQIYSEAIPYLYSANYFATMFPETIQYLPRLLLPQRLNLIRSLGIVWEVKEMPLFFDEALGKARYNDQWNDIWKNIADMEGLRDLLVALPIAAKLHDRWRQEELTFLQPLKAVTRPKTFVLILPFPTRFRDRDFLDFPCTVFRRPGMLEA